MPGHESTKAPTNRQHVQLKSPLWAAQQNALIFPDCFRLLVCPAKVMGRWNTCGTDDLREAISATAPQVLQVLGVTVTDEIEEMLAAGRYKIREVHIAHQFWLHDRCITDFLVNLRRRLNESHTPVGLPPGRGIGFFLYPASRTAIFLFYNKLHEFRNKGLSFYARRIATFWDNERRKSHTFLGADRIAQQVYAAAGPRLEIRLGDHFFRGSDLQYGSNWLPKTADTIYIKKLESLELPTVVPAVAARVRARARLTRAYSTFLHWAVGQDLADIGMSRKTMYSHRRSILKALGIDIRKPASSVLGNRKTVNARETFKWENRVVPEAVDFDALSWLGDDYKPEDKRKTAAHQ